MKMPKYMDEAIVMGIKAMKVHASVKNYKKYSTPLCEFKLSL